MNVIRFTPALRIPEFVLGMLAGYLFLEGHIARRYAIRLVTAAVAALGVLVICANRIPRPMISAGYPAPIFAALILGLALRPRWVRMLEGCWWVLLGEASYSLYLLHTLAIIVGFNLFRFLPNGARLAVALGLALALALLCYALIERPARRLLRPAPQLPQSVDIPQQVAPA